MRVLFVDDDAALRGVLTRELTASGFEVSAFEDAASALDAFARTSPDVALLDLRMPETDGRALHERLRELDAALPVVFLTGHGAVPDAVAAMRSGAFDFLTKPVELEQLERTLLRAAEHGNLLRENERLRTLVEPRRPAPDFIGESDAARDLLRLVDRAGESGQNVLIVGENGTGKEWVARRLHEVGPRADKPFVVVNCGAIPEALVESELFGHERGAFTGADRRRTGLFEAAHGGTLFLDEFGELPLSVQPKLLRAAQSGELRRVGSERVEHVDVRIVAATNRDVERAMLSGEFREDLYYRVATLLIRVPPLRERAEDVEPLFRSFLREEGSALQPTAGALERLRRYAWPGNVRELRNAAARVAALIDGPEVRAEDVDRLVTQRHVDGAGALPSLDLEELERVAIVAALRLHAGNRKRAAGELGIAVKTLYNKMLRYEIDVDRALGAD